jgi:hypothetical protein
MRSGSATWGWNIYRNPDKADVAPLAAFCVG